MQIVERDIESKAAEETWVCPRSPVWKLEDKRKGAVRVKGRVRESQLSGSFVLLVWGRTV